MSFLVRAAVLGGLAYLVTRVVRSQREADFLAGSGAYRLPETAERVRDDVWETDDRHATSTSIGNP